MRLQAAWRGTAATVTSLVLTIALAELAAWALLRCSITTLPSRSEIQASLAPREGSAVDQRIAPQPHLPEPLRQHILHPYLGFVRNPEIQRHVFNSRVVAEPVNEYGFFGPSPLQAGDPGTLAVVITGGSVAADLYLRSSDALRTELRSSPTRGFFSREPLRRSLSLVLWNRLHGRLLSELLALLAGLGDLQPRSQLGRASRMGTIEEVLAEATELWDRSSIQMWKTCRSNGSVYVHILQPNQYLAGSKPLDAKERRMEWPPDFPHRLAAEQGYPLLIAAGEGLERLGVPFRDLTRIFESERGTIYVDPCCHYNQRGNDMLAAEIGRFVAASVEAAGALPPRPWVGPGERLAS